MAVDLALGASGTGSRPGGELLRGLEVVVGLAGAGLFVTATRPWSAGALLLYFCLSAGVRAVGIFVKTFGVYAAYSSTAEDLAPAAALGLLVVFALPLGPSRAAWGSRAFRILFGVCAVLFGGAHFAYPQFTIPLVPRWLPPSQVFWANATGAFQIAAGLAFMTGRQARLAAVLLTGMYASFTPLVHAPLLLSDPHKAFFWTENALNILLTGAAWTLADSYGWGKPRALRPNRSADIRHRS